jgi:Tfp pilus assembly protein FimV
VVWPTAETNLPRSPRSAYVVQPGDTLWAIAERWYPGAEVAEVVDALVSLNGGATIQAGQTLHLP